MRHECPICDAQFDEFAAITKTRPRKAKCPNCGSAERHRLFWLLQKADGLLPEGGRMLHFAPEPWLIKPMSERYGLGYLCVDYEYPPYDLKVDIQDLPFREGLFSGLICMGVLEHVPDDYKAMRELSRVLEPGGIDLIHVPLQFKTHASWREKLGPVARKRTYGQYNHLRYYGLDFADDLKANGFSETQIIAPYDRYSAEDIVRFGLANTSRVVVARK